MVLVVLQCLIYTAGSLAGVTVQVLVLITCSPLQSYPLKTRSFLKAVLK